MKKILRALALVPALLARDAYTVHARSADDADHTRASGGDVAAMAATCVGTSRVVPKYRKQRGGAWVRDGVETVTGVWTVDGCRLPEASWRAPAPASAPAPRGVQWRG